MWIWQTKDSIRLTLLCFKVYNIKNQIYLFFFNDMRKRIVSLLEERISNNDEKILELIANKHEALTRAKWNREWLHGYLQKTNKQIKSLRESNERLERIVERLR